MKSFQLPYQLKVRQIYFLNMNFTGNLFLGFSRYWDKLYPEYAVFHLF